MVILDLDGVVADFARAACVVHNYKDYEVTKWNFFEDWGINTEEFWSQIHRYEDTFYRLMVKPYPWTVELLQLVDRADDFVIMTSPSNHPSAYSGKKIWVDKYLQPHLDHPIKLIVGSEKPLLANKQTLLIDDRDENINEFRSAGGWAVTFPQLWNTQKDVAAEDKPEYLKYFLPFWTSMQERSNVKRTAEAIQS